jgi:dihydroorotate dehydrogenase electron transfer subunit
MAEYAARRDSLVLEQAAMLACEALPGRQYLLRLDAPRCAALAEPGSFVHLQCDPCLPLRRPLSLLRVDAAAGWVEILFKVVGTGTRLLADRQVGDRLSLLGPIGRPFMPHRERPRPLLIGGGVGIPPMVFLADRLRGQPGVQPLALFGSEAPFPFMPRPSQILVPDLPDEAIACMPLLDDWGVASRLASLASVPGCYQGYVTDLARRWLAALDADVQSQVEIFACGPHPMLAATARLAAEFDLPCQVSMEEFMACGIGGCAGCTIPVETAQGVQMQRVCVDGPVFDARQAFPQ